MATAKSLTWRANPSIRPAREVSPHRGAERAHSPRPFRAPRIGSPCKTSSRRFAPTHPKTTPPCPARRRTARSGARAPASPARRGSRASGTASGSASAASRARACGRGSADPAPAGAPGCENGAWERPEDRAQAPLHPTGSAGIGGAERDRTVDLLIANEALSQLSYSPTGPEEARIIGAGLGVSSVARARRGTGPRAKNLDRTVAWRGADGSCSVVFARLAPAGAPSRAAARAPSPPPFPRRRP